MSREGHRYILDDQDKGVKVDITVNSIPVECDGKKARVYLLPGVPKEAGRIDSEIGVSLDKMLSFLEEKAGISTDSLKRSKKILEKYKGRLIDTSSILYYANEQNRFDEFAERLEQEYSKLSHIPSDMMFARTDVMAFFHKLYMDLDIGNKKEQKKFINFEKSLGGPGLIVFPD